MGIQKRLSATALGVAVGVLASLTMISPANAQTVPTPTSVSQSSIPDDAEPSAVAPMCTGCGYGKTITKLSSSRVNARHVKYLTSSWAKASQYVWSETVNVTASVTTDVGVSVKSLSGSIGVTYSTSKGFSVATTIPANSKKYSKLALRSDFYKNHVRVVTKAQGITVKDVKTYLYSPIKNTQTLYVKYQ